MPPSALAAAAPSCLVDVGEHHLGALGDEALGDGEPDPARRAGDDGDSLASLGIGAFSLSRSPVGEVAALPKLARQRGVGVAAP